MQNLRFVLPFFAVIVAAFTLSCGSNQGQGKLQSIAVTPAAASAQQAQFTATGFYVNPSHAVTPQPATWGACYQGAPTTDVTVANNGLAQCASGATALTRSGRMIRLMSPQDVRQARPAEADALSRAAPNSPVRNRLR